MKIQTIFSGALVTAILFASSAAMAAPNHNQLNVNTHKMEMRIDAGVKSGKLTPNESRQLRSELSKLKATIKAANKDHKITNWERNTVQAKEKALNKHITVLSNNKVVVKKQDKHHQAPAKKFSQNKH